MKKLIALGAAVLVVGCSGSDTGLSKEEERNFKEGMSAAKVKEVGPAPKPPSGPQQAYEGGSAADKALGR